MGVGEWDVMGGGSWGWRVALDAMSPIPATLFTRCPPCSHAPMTLA